MAKTLQQVREQIAKLQQVELALKAMEIPGVVQRIREAVEHYGLTVEHIFGAAASKSLPVKSAKGKQASKKSAPAKKAPLPAKFRDEAGNSWSGHGKRPNWFKDALASGKTLEDITVMV